jgi:alkylated DNA nucleotide flippase Atl1
VIPCHRVVNSDGDVGSYKGIKDSKQKIKLLKKEGLKVKSNKLNLKKYLFSPLLICLLVV